MEINNTDIYQKIDHEKLKQQISLPLTSQCHILAGTH
jgi:hypothetical protein